MWWKGLIAYGYLHFPAVWASGQRPVGELCPLTITKREDEGFIDDDDDELKYHIKCQFQCFCCNIRNQINKNISQL